MRRSNGQFRQQVGLAIIPVIACIAVSLHGTVAAAEDATYILYSDETLYGSQELAGLTDSASLESPEIATGTVRNPSGIPIAGMTVTLVVWPSGETLSKLGLGEKFTVHPVAYAITTRDGSYSLRISDARMLTPFASSDQLVDLVVAPADTRKAVPYSFTRKLTSQTGPTGAEYSLVNRETGPGWSSGPEVVNFVTAEDPPGHNVDGATPEPGPGVIDEDPTTEPAFVDMATCTGGTDLKYGPRGVNIGGHYSTVDAAKLDLSYTSGSNSDLGVGFSSSGKYGSFKLAGNKGKSSSSTYNYGPRYGIGSWHRYTQYTYYRIHLECQGIDRTWDEYWVMPDDHVGGGFTKSFSSVDAPSADYCGIIEANATFSKSNSKAVTWSTGVKIGGAIGIDLTSQTGYSSGTTVKFKNRANMRHEICGTKGYPGAAPSRLVFRW